MNETLLDTVTCGDWRDLLRALEPGSVDLLLTDMPYGTTACAWDVRPDLDEWWTLVKPVMKPRGAVVCTASQPFTSLLVVSNLDWFRYEWVWEKDNGTNFLSLQKQPFKVHENIIVFSENGCQYNPQMSDGRPYRAKAGMVYRDYLGAFEKGTTTVNGGDRYPRSVQKFSQERTDHPTQKPVALFEYLIRTYTQPGDLVFDPFVGSGTTALAARNTGRHFIVGDLDAGYCETARRRLAEPYTLPLFPDDPAPEPSAMQLSLLDEESL